MRRSPGQKTMDEKSVDELPVEDEQAPSKSWLKNTEKSMTRLENVKKTYYRLGGGPKEREVDCQCNYRSKHHSSFVNMSADPPTLSQESQETASFQNVPISDLVKAQKNKSINPKQKQRPYSATIHRVDQAISHDVEVTASKGKKAFIAVKGMNLTPAARPKSASCSSSNLQTSKGNLWHLDPDYVHKDEQIMLEGLRKYSAYGQKDETTTDVTLPRPPRASPDISEKEDSHDLQSSSDDFSDDDFEQELKPLSIELNNGSKPQSLVFQIPTAETYDNDDEETIMDNSGQLRDVGSVPSNIPSFQATTRDDFVTENTCGETPRVNDRALSADYIEKSDTFLDELARKQTQEAEELSEMFNKMNQNQEQIDSIDLRSVMTTPASARNVTTPTTRQDTSGATILNMTLPSPERTFGETPTESTWVEEPYIPRIKQNQENTHSPMGRFHSQKLRVQSANTHRRTQERGTFVLRGTTLDIMDAKDLAAMPRGLSNKVGKNMEESNSRKGDQVVGKPPRPKGSSSRKKKRADSASTQRKSSGHEYTGKVSQPPLLSFAGKSSLRKCLSQGDMRSLSPEVAASVKKTVSFSDEVLDKPTRLITSSAKEKTYIDLEVEAKDTIPDVDELEQVKQTNVTHSSLIDYSESKERESLEENRTGVDPMIIHNRLDFNEDTLCSAQKAPDSESSGFLIQNGQEVKKHNPRSHRRPVDNGTNTTVNVIAKVKNATRCSCNVEGCHCREITRPTMAVLSKSKTAANQSHPSQKLLKQRLNRPTSAPIRRKISSNTITRSKHTQVIQHKRSDSERVRRQRPLSAHIKRPSVAEPRQNQPHNRKFYKDSKTNKATNQPTSHGVEFVWGPGDDDVAASEECREVYAKFKEKGINVSMETVKRGLMAPARRASESCMASFGSSSSSGLLSRPEKWLPEEYKRVKIWDDVLKKL